MSYSNYYACQKCLDGVLAIDYYLAMEVLCALGREEDALLLHSIMATSASLRDGHSCLKLDAEAGKLCWDNQAISKPGYEFPRVDTWRSHLSELAISPAAGNPLVFDMDRLYLRRYWQFEIELAAYLRRMLNETVAVDHEHLSQILARLFPDTGSGDEQLTAVANAVHRKLAIIIGGPGTGKTYTVTRLLLALNQLADAPMTIRMAAPTGKAAQRLVESVATARVRLAAGNDDYTGALDAIPAEACTLHRLLGALPGNRFRHDENNPLKLDLLVVDEVSMIDLPMMARLVRAMPAHARLLLLGDADQLPSVAAGSILTDIAPRPHPGYSSDNAARLESLTGTRFEVSATPADYLTELVSSRRFDPTGGIGKLARQVISGDGNSWETLAESSQQLSLAQDTGFDGWLNSLVESHYLRIFDAPDVEVALERLSEFRILATNRVGLRGTLVLNEHIEDLLSRLGKIPRNQSVYSGRPIMVTANDYTVGLFNGDVGLLWPDESGKVKAVFPDGENRLRYISPARLPAVESVYAMTIHKTQGSEFSHVALVLPEQDNPVLSRELLYTGITRASEKLSVFVDKTVWDYTIRHTVQRYSGLAERISNE